MKTQSILFLREDVVKSPDAVAPKADGLKYNMNDFVATQVS